MTDAGLQATGTFIAVDTDHSRVTAKVFRRLIGFLFVAYFFSYLDRINIGFAALSMNKDLALTATMFGFANTLFYLTYMIFEVPSNLLLARFGARIWIARIMVTWGIASTATMFATGPYSLYFTRALVGLAEAGFVPGVILYLSYWFPTAHRARAMALLMMAMPATFMLGSPMSGLILQLHGALGIAGWRCRSRRRSKRTAPRVSACAPRSDDPPTISTCSSIAAPVSISATTIRARRSSPMTARPPRPTPWATSRHRPRRGRACRTCGWRRAARSMTRWDLITPCCGLIALSTSQAWLQPPPRPACR